MPKGPCSHQRLPSVPSTTMCEPSRYSKAFTVASICVRCAGTFADAKAVGVGGREYAQDHAHREEAYSHSPDTRENREEGSAEQRKIAHTLSFSLLNSALPSMEEARSFFAPLQKGDGGASFLAQAYGTTTRGLSPARPENVARHGR